MGLLCKIKGHKWDEGRCTRCGYRHETDAHIWKDGLCSVCGRSVLKEVTAWQGSDHADQLLASIHHDTTQESQNTLIHIALNLLDTNKSAHYDIGKKAAALITDEELLLQRFTDWAQAFEETKRSEKWEVRFASTPISEAFTHVSDQTRQEMNAIMKPHLIQIALNAWYQNSAWNAIYHIQALGRLSDEDAKRFIPLTENSVYVFQTVPMLMNCSPIWKTLLTKGCISTLGGIMKGSGDRSRAAELMKKIYQAGCQKDAIRKYNGTVIFEASFAPTDDDNYGVGNREKVTFWVC